MQTRQSSTANSFALLRQEEERMMMCLISKMSEQDSRGEKELACWDTQP